ncbi:hypothetical protein EG329_003756 [Mollisiaceae sp. DMI_Dod_QoI]|nr:hypothetical protein EG329_003756 [Helotiales sp. DMI_Dod_QoI]
MSTFTPQVQKLWADAQTRPEWASTKFWEYIFSHNIFDGPEWVVSSQQPPTYDDGDLRRIDLVVENIDENANSAALMFMEAKRASATLDLVLEVEYQAFTACCAALYATGRESIWAMTCVGTRAKLWAYRRDDDYLTQFYPLSDNLSEKDEYVEYSSEVLTQLEYIQRNFVPPKEVFDKKPPSPRPATATLPEGWHDTEVVQVAGTSQSLRRAASGEMLRGGEPLSLAGQQQSTAQVIAEHSTLLTVTKILSDNGQLSYRCMRPDNKDIIVGQDQWIASDILQSGRIYQGYTYIGKSGTRYYTWTLEAKRREAAR